MTEQQRLVILRILTEVTARTTNSSIIYNLLAKYGVPTSKDKVKTELGWLQEQGLVTLERVDDLLIATLTGRGNDVAKGLVEIDGVATPGA